MKFDKFDNIEVPEEVDSFIKNGIKKAEKIKKKRKVQKVVDGIYNISIVLWSFDK